MRSEEEAEEKKEERLIGQGEEGGKKGEESER